jgi:DNA-binding NarL/FixJ family response regulator
MPPSGQDEGIRLAVTLRETHPALGVIVLSTYAEVGYALKLFESGCDGRGYMLKDRIRERGQVLQAIQTVANGGSFVDPGIVQDLVSSDGSNRRSALEDLTPRELETLALVAEGQSNAAIADSLVLSKRAVEKHVNAIFAKLQLGESDRVSRRVKAVLQYLADRDASTGTHVLAGTWMTDGRDPTNSTESTTLMATGETPEVESRAGQ